MNRHLNSHVSLAEELDRVATAYMVRTLELGETPDQDLVNVLYDAAHELLLLRAELAELRIHCFDMLDRSNDGRLDGLLAWNRRSDEDDVRKEIRALWDRWGL